MFSLSLPVNSGISDNSLSTLGKFTDEHLLTEFITLNKSLIKNKKNTLNF